MATVPVESFPGEARSGKGVAWASETMPTYLLCLGQVSAGSLGLSRKLKNLWAARQSPRCAGCIAKVANHHGAGNPDLLPVSSARGSHLRDLRAV